MQKILSIFVDESGDFGKYEKHAPYYVVTMLFHDQSQDISKQILSLETSLAMNDLQSHCLHTGPLVRKEEYYEFLTIDERKRILNIFMAFATKIDFKYKTFIVEKRADMNNIKLITALSTQVKEFLRDNFAYFDSFDKIKIYYDSGQKELTAILAAIFANNKVVFKQHVRPSLYRLFQIADLLTTFELINKKREANCNSKTEEQFFVSMSKFKKDYYKRFLKHRL